MTDEFDQMAKALNDALDIEQNASHTQRLFTILSLRAQALREQETLLELERITRQRDRAESRVMRLLAGHARFIESIYSRASAIRDVTEEFQAEVGERAAEGLLDVFDLALAKMREQRDNGERHDLDDVAEEEGVSLDPDDFGVNEVDPEEIDALDPLQLADLEPKPQVRMDFPDTTEKRIGGETTTDFVDERNRVPFSDGDVQLDLETRNWMQETAAGGVRDDV